MSDRTQVSDKITKDHACLIYEQVKEAARDQLLTAGKPTADVEELIQQCDDTVARELEASSDSNDLIIPLSVIDPLLHAIASDFHSQISLGDDALEALRHAAEKYVVDYHRK